MKQLTIYVENKIGSLSQLLIALSDLEINVRSVVTERINVSEVRLIVDDPEKAQEALVGIEISSHLVDIVVVELDNKPGELARLTKILDDNKVNIDYIYGIDNSEHGKGLFAIKTDLPFNELSRLLSDFSLK